MLGGNHSKRGKASIAFPLGDLIVQGTVSEKTKMRTVILILGKIDQVTVPGMPITQLVQTLVLSVTDFRASSI